jgi:hypothetical protein
MTAAGKINASNVQINDRIIVKTNDERTGCTWSANKTGENVIVARVTGKSFRAAQGPYEARGKFSIETTAGTMQDAAGVKRAHVEALAENKRMDRAATPAEVEAPAQAEIIREAAQAARTAPTQAEAAEIMATAMGLPTEALASWAAANWTAPTTEVPMVELEAPMADLYELAAPGLTFPLPVRPEGRELVRISDLRELIPASLLTLHSQGGKVDNMNKPSETSTQTETTPAERHTGSSVVKLIEKVWDRIRADHPELPEVVVTTGSGEGIKWGHFRPNSWKLEEEKRHEFFLASEALAKGATQVLQTTIHEAAHTLSKTRGIKDTSRQGRWHNAVFKKTAEELGLEHKGAAADKSHGFSFVTLTEATKVKYADLLTELDQELKLTGLLPFWMGGQDKGDEDERGGEKITGKPTKGGAEGGSASGPVKAVCDCEEPVIIRISQKVMDMGVVRCDGCESLFHRP